MRRLYHPTQCRKTTKLGHLWQLGELHMVVGLDHFAKLSLAQTGAAPSGEGEAGVYKQQQTRVAHAQSWIAKSNSNL